MRRSVKVYGWWLEAATKYDYFIVGLALAIVGYWAKDFRPVPLGFNPSTAELLSMLAVLGSAYSGLKRIEAMSSTLIASHNWLDAGEGRAALMEVAYKGTPAINTGSGEVIDPGGAVEGAEKLKKRGDRADQEASRWSARAKRWYRCRDALLIIGVCGFIASRLWAAYK